MGNFVNLFIIIFVGYSMANNEFDTQNKHMAYCIVMLLAWYWIGYIKGRTDEKL